MFRRSVNLKSSGRLVVRVTMAYNNQDGHRGGNRGHRGRGGFPRPYARSSESYGQGSRYFHRSEASKDNGVQGSQYSNDGSGQNYGNNSGQRNQPGSYPHNEMRGIGRGQGYGHRNDNIQGTQPSLYQEDSQKGDRAQGHGNGVKSDSYQSDSQKGDKTLGYGPWSQSGTNQDDSQKGDMTQRNSMKGDMAQSHRQGDESVSCQGDLQEGIGGTQGLGHGAEPVSYQEDLQEKSDKAQHNENNSRQGIQPDFGQSVLWKGTEGETVQGFEKGTEPSSCQGGSQETSGVNQGHGQGAEAGSYQGHSEENNDWGQHNRKDSRQGDQPVIDQKVSQKGKDGYHVECTQPSSNKYNSKEGNDMRQSHGNDSIQRTQPASHQKDSQKGSDRGQSHGNDSGQWNKPGPNQGNWRKGGESSGGQYYHDNRSHSYQGQKDSGQESRYSSQASSGGGFRRDNFDQQQRKRNRVDDEDDIFLSKTLSFILRHGAEKLKFKLMPGGFLYVDEILKKMQKLEGFTVEDVERIVAQNDKQRFAIQKEEGTGRLKIRANQGHSVEVEDLELTPITSADQVPIVLHGTYHDAWNSIKKQGLCRFKRNHIHFAAGEPGENGVISGMRSSCEVLIYIDLEKALKGGLKFYLSANKVILSPGNEKGYIYPCYFQAVVNRYPYHILEFDPNIKGKTVSADQISDESDKKKKKKKKNKKNKEERESNERVAPREEIKDAGNTNLVAGAGEKQKEEQKDEEDQYEDAMETQSEKSMQINVPDQWDATDNVEQNSKGTEQSEGAQGVSGYEDSVGTKESKTKEKDSWSETSKRASKSKAQSRSQAPKATTKPETPQISVIPEGEQKAIKTGAFTPKDEDEGAATVTTEDAEDVKIEEEWMEVYITSAEESQSAVEYIIKQKEPVSIICCGDKIGEGDGKITVLMISIKGRIWIYQLSNMEKDFMEVGKLKHLFFDTDLMKVFHDVTWQSAVLFKQYEIVLDGTKVFDSKVVCQQKLIDAKAMDSLRLEGFMPSRWMEEDGKIDNSKWIQNPLDKELINKLVERCKALLQFYKIFTMLKLTQPRREIYLEVNKYVDKKRSKEIKKNFKSQAENKPPQEQPTSSSEEQRKGSGSPKKGKKNKRK